ncbi:MAG: hypothetical protein HHJ14_10110 [Cellulomonas sp.]|nr:hypothetical protein [Cellulomonas sp.]
MRYRFRPMVAAVAATALLAGLLSALQIIAAPLPAQAAAVTDFEPGYIMSDSILYDSATMNADAIQAFLNAKGAGCVAAAGNTCLKDYVESTPTRSSDALCTGTYSGATNDSSARIIAKAAVACGINPQVLLVTLQKEQSLVTATAGKSAATYSRALGFGCPDSAGGQCDPQYAGFANQVYSAAKQLQRYAANPNSYSYRARRTNTILWNPNTGCGASSVYIENQATASLYDYTPYRPNDSALAAGYGSGDSCASYGNRNFHLYFRDWFGSATQRTPYGSIDLVADGGANTIHVAGWALDPDVAASIAVHVYVDGSAVAALAADRPRPDVNAVYGRGTNRGYDAFVDASTGDHSVCLYAIDGNGGTNVLLGCRSVTVVNHTPFGSIDLVQASGPTTIDVAGWALDQDVARSIPVHVYVDGSAVAAVTAANPRPDVQAVFGFGANHGYGVTVQAAPGTHTVCIYAIDATGGTNVLLGCRTVSLVNHTPDGSLDLVRDTGQSSIQLAGWALDQDVANSINVHVYIDGSAVAAVTAANPRPDVDAVYRHGANHGFDLALPVAVGTHNVCVYGIDGNGGTNVVLGCRTVTIGNQTPLGSIDVVQDAGSGSILVAGWALDPDMTTPINVHVYVDGLAVLALTAANPRPDVDAAFARGPNHGFATTFPSTAGAHTVCLYAIDGNGGTNVLLGCRAVKVS